MPLSQRKQAKMARQKRIDEVAIRSLNGKGDFMDSHQEADARAYIETGDKRHLDYLPDYRKISPERRS